MCWSGEASATLATAGLATSYYLYRKGEAKSLYITLAYFSGMEALQAYTYTVINQCDVAGNQVATVLGYLHIAFQPFFVNAVSMYFIPPPVRKKIQKYVYTLCFFGAIFYIARLYPYSWATPCYETRWVLPFGCKVDIPFCGQQICSTSGVWHIAWQIPARFLWLGDNAYLLTGFILPLIYGSWRMTIYHFISGPLLAIATTNNANEWAAVWCLYSIGLLGIVIKSPLRRWLHVNYWPGWKTLM
jgi:hypothetical protein